MTDTSIWAHLATYTPIVIGGMLVLAGQLLADRLTARRERGMLKRERLESLVKALYAHTRWIKDQYIELFKEGNHDLPNSFDEVSMIQTLYFPQLAKEILAVQKAELALIQFNLDQRMAITKDRAAWLKAWDSSPFNEMYVTYLGVVNEATARCRELLPKG